MEAKDKIAKLTWQLFEGVKDVVQADLANAVRGGQIKVDPSALPTLISLVNASIEAGYHRGSRTFEKSVTAVINDVAMPKMSVATVPAKKK